MHGRRCHLTGFQGVNPTSEKRRKDVAVSELPAGLGTQSLKGRSRADQDRAGDGDFRLRRCSSS